MASSPIYNGTPPAAPAPLDMSTILSKMNEGLGPQRSARFAVRIKLTGGSLTRDTQLFAEPYFRISNDLVYLCEVAEFPGRSFMNSDIRYYGPSVKFPFQSVYEDVNFTFLCRPKSEERYFFDGWMEKINPISTFDFNYKKDYASTIDIFQLDEQHKTSYMISLLEAYPIQISPQPVTWADDNFQRLAVTFTYSKWYREQLDKLEITPTANT